MKTVYTVAYKPILAKQFEYFDTFASLEEAKEFVVVRKAGIHKHCGSYNLEDNFRIIERLENESIKIV